MKNLFFTAACALAFVFSSCVKNRLILQGNTIDYCRITTISGANSDFPDTLTFFYNPDGTPSHIDRQDVTDGSPKYLFRYDNQGRLLDYVAAFDNGAAESWIRYYYNEATRTVIDTQYTDARQYQTWPPYYFGFVLSEVKRYDELGRIVSYQHYILYQVPGSDSAELMYSQTYTYDREGDLAGLPHDDKINIHRTNPVWQFIDNDYATNNEISIQPFNAQYDTYKLPILMPGSNSVPFLFDLEFPTLAIRYSCDTPVKEESSGR
jgi:hypothetical protein